MKRLVIVSALLMLSGCVTNVAVVGGGNKFTFSNNSNGVHTGKVLSECADLIVKAMPFPEGTDADKLFTLCIKANGVSSI